MLSLMEFVSTVFFIIILVLAVVGVVVELLPRKPEEDES
jgi:predicted membrane channel-forming protein YqfA (hemolysin III family)